MSQNHITLPGRSGPVNLILGWDRRLQELYCTVIPENDEDPTDYSDLHLSSFDSVDDMRATLAEHGIDVPPAVLAAAAGDQAANAGNVSRTFASNGALLEAAMV